MNNSLKKIIPHTLAVLSFILITLVYFSPLLEGKKLKQAYVSNFKGMSKDIVDYGEAHPGEEPLWTNYMFSGMPALLNLSQLPLHFKLMLFQSA